MEVAAVCNSYGVLGGCLLIRLKIISLWTINTSNSDAWLITVSVRLCNTVLRVRHRHKKRSSNRSQIPLIDFYLSWSPAGPLAPRESDRRLMDSSFKLRQSHNHSGLSFSLPVSHSFTSYGSFLGRQTKLSLREEPRWLYARIVCCSFAKWELWLREQRLF